MGSGRRGQSFLNLIEDALEVVANLFLPAIRFLEFTLTLLKQILQAGLDLDELLRMLNADLREAWQPEMIRIADLHRIWI